MDQAPRANGRLAPPGGQEARHSPSDDLRLGERQHEPQWPGSGEVPRVSPHSWRGGRPVNVTWSVPEGRLTVSVPEAGRMLGIGRDAAYAAAARGEIPTLRLGRTLRVSVPQILELLGVTAGGGTDAA